MDAFTVTFLMEDLLLNLQVPQAPRVVITADKRATVKVSRVCVEPYTETGRQVYQVVPRNLPEGCQVTRDTRSP